MSEDTVVEAAKQPHRYREGDALQYPVSEGLIRERSESLRAACIPSDWVRHATYACVSNQHKKCEGTVYHTTGEAIEPCACPHHAPTEQTEQPKAKPCALGGPYIYGPQPYRWCATHERMMFECEKKGLGVTAKAAEQPTNVLNAAMASVSTALREDLAECHAVDFVLSALTSAGLVIVEQHSRQNAPEGQVREVINAAGRSAESAKPAAVWRCLTESEISQWATYTLALISEVRKARHARLPVAEQAAPSAEEEARKAAPNGFTWGYHGGRRIALSNGPTDALVATGDSESSWLEVSDENAKIIEDAFNRHPQ